MSFHIHYAARDVNARCHMWLHVAVCGCCSLSGYKEQYETACSVCCSESDCMLEGVAACSVCCSVSGYNVQYVAANGVMLSMWLQTVWCSACGCKRCDAQYLTANGVMLSTWLQTVWCSVRGCKRCDAQYVTANGVMLSTWLQTVWCSVCGCKRCDAQYVAANGVMLSMWLQTVWCSVCGCKRCDAQYVAANGVMLSMWLQAVWCSVCGCKRCDAQYVAAQCSQCKINWCLWWNRDATFFQVNVYSTGLMHLIMWLFSIQNFLLTNQENATSHHNVFFSHFASDGLFNVTGTAGTRWYRQLQEIAKSVIFIVYFMKMLGDREWGRGIIVINTSLSGFIDTICTRAYPVTPQPWSNHLWHV